MIFNLNAEARGEIMAEVNEWTDDVVKDFKDNFDEMIRFYQENRYLPLLRLAQYYENLYTTEVSTKLLGAFTDWEASAYSIVRFTYNLLASEGGDTDSAVAAKTLEEELKGAVERMANVPFVYPTISSEVQLSKDEDAIMADVADYTESLSRWTENWPIKFLSFSQGFKKNENQLYQNVYELFVRLFTVLDDFVKHFMKMLDGLRRDILIRGVVEDAAVEEQITKDSVKGNYFDINPVYDSSKLGF